MESVRSVLKDPGFTKEAYCDVVGYYLLLRVDEASNSPNNRLRLRED